MFCVRTTYAIGAHGDQVKSVELLKKAVSEGHERSKQLLLVLNKNLRKEFAINVEIE
jgi:hypothetical protein